MSIAFDDASTQYLSSANAIVTASPCTLACWFMTDDLAIGQVLLSCGASGSTHQYTLLAALNVALDPVRAIVTGSAGGITSDGQGTTANVWNHACAIFIDDNNPRGYLNGVNTLSALGAGNVVSGIDRSRIGLRANSASTNPMSGQIAEAAIWNVAISTADLDQLVKGYSPKLVRPEALVAYWPLLDQATPSIDVRAANNMTWNSSPTVGASHPAMFGG